MGVEIVKAAMVHGRRLSGNGYKVLIAMSMQALDKPSNGRPASLYWGGWGNLAHALGHPEESGSDRNSTGHKAVKRAIRELRESSHITPLLDAHKGTRQSYLVHPGGIAKGDQIDPVKGDQNDPGKGGQNGPQRGVKMTPPRTHRGSSEDLAQDTSGLVPAQVTTAREDEQSNGDGAHRFRPSLQDSDSCECGKGKKNRAVHPVHLIQGA